MPSSYRFRAELDPAESCRFGTDADVMVNDLGFLALGSTLWVRAVQRDDVFDDLKAEVEDMIRLLLGAYALHGGRGLTHWLESWVEEHDSERGVATIGVISKFDFTPDPTHSAMLEEAAATVVDVQALGGADWRFALLDIGAASRDAGDDSFLYAHRSVVDCVRALSPTGNDREWPLLHTLLGETEQVFRARFQPLQDARDKIAHGNRQAPVLVAARAQRDQFLDLARAIVRTAILRSRPPRPPRSL